MTQRSRPLILIVDAGVRGGSEMETASWKRLEFAPVS